MLIKKIKRQTIAEETRTLLKGRENLSALQLETLYTDLLNQQLNNIA